jgi:hypothetical protein
LFVGDKRARSFEIVKQITNIPISANEYDISKENPYHFDQYYFCPKIYKKNLIWGVNDFFSQFQMPAFFSVFTAADVVFICFSLINRPSFDKLVEVILMDDTLLINRVHTV